MGADPATNAGKDIVLPDQFKGFGKTAGPGKGNVPLDVDAKGAAFFAQGKTAFVYGYAPGKALATGKPDRRTAVAGSGACHRAGLYAAAAEDAGIGIDKCLILLNVNAKPLAAVFYGCNAGREKNLIFGFRRILISPGRCA
jgi:hypothetical protein